MQQLGTNCVITVSNHNVFQGRFSSSGRSRRGSQQWIPQQQMKLKLERWVLVTIREVSGLGLDLVIIKEALISFHLS